MSLVAFCSRSLLVVSLTNYIHRITIKAMRYIIYFCVTRLWCLSWKYNYSGGGVGECIASEPLMSERNLSKNPMWILPSDVPARHQAPQGARNAVADGPAHGLVGAAPAALRAARVRQRLRELRRLMQRPNDADSLSGLKRFFIIYMYELSKGNKATPYGVFFVFLYLRLDSWLFLYFRKKMYYSFFLLYVSITKAVYNTRAHPLLFKSSFVFSPPFTHPLYSQVM